MRCQDNMREARIMVMKGIVVGKGYEQMFWWCWQYSIFWPERLLCGYLLANNSMNKVYFYCTLLQVLRDSQMVLAVKNLFANAGDLRDMGLIPGSGRSSGEGNGNPLQYSCLENPMDRRVWRVTVHGSQRVGHNWKAT